MPLLQALLDDDEFLADAKKSVGIKDDEVQRLKDAAAQGTSQLDEGDKAQHSSKASSDEAKKQVTDILGAERGQKLIGLVQQKWSGEQAGTPSSVPTDTRVVVNIPAYRMDLFNQGKLVKTYKIGIGYPEFPLPTGIRKAKQLIVNPSWTPPDEPWVKGKVHPHEKVEPGSKLNPLGPIKIPIGGPSLIHGGKRPDRLGNFASHGCVGLTDQGIEDFAVQISSLAGKPLSLADLKGYEKNKTETKSVDLAQEIPVELRYETIVVENGTLKIFRDVYERGTNTEENLRRVLQTAGTSLDQLDEQMRKDILAALQQMNTDAAGQPVDGKTTASSNSNKGADAEKKVKITYNVKGKKEVDFPIQQLAGKGYPAPVNLT
jgi:lipoprotein-anchoring transpeptidase ErfK/SrfK